MKPRATLDVQDPDGRPLRPEDWREFAAVMRVNRPDLARRVRRFRLVPDRCDPSRGRLLLYTRR